MKRDRGRRRRLAGHRPIYQQPSNRLLLRLLVAQGTQTGLALRTLASKVGVSYSMMAKWRADEALIARSSDEVLDAIGRFLGMPTILVRLLAGAMTLDDFRWPGDESIELTMVGHLLRPPGDRLPGRIDEAAIQHHRLLAMAAMLDGRWEQGGQYFQRTQRWLEDAAEILLEEGATHRE